MKIIKKFIAKIFYNIIHSEYYDKLKPNENSVSYIKNNLHEIGRNIILDNSIMVKGAKYISIGDDFSALKNLRLEALDSYYDQKFIPKIQIGDNVSINTDCHIGCISEVLIGNNVLIASRVYITDHSHGLTNTEQLSSPPILRNLVSKGPVIIGDNVWIGEGVSILSGVTIGKNSIIGTNAVVNKSFPENSIIAGVPAKLIRTIC